MRLEGVIRRVVPIVAATLLFVAPTIVGARASVSPSVLPPECVGPDGAGHVVCTYSVHNDSGTPSYTLAVPAQATDVVIEATGASGADESSSVLGGLGGHVAATMDGASSSTIPGSSLTIVVGETGHNFSACPTGGFPNGGSGGFRSANCVAGGGGSSSVALGVSPLVVAGAGGGAGSPGAANGPGAGGDAGSNGTAGTVHAGSGGGGASGATPGTGGAGSPDTNAGSKGGDGKDPTLGGVGGAGASGSSSASQGAAGGGGGGYAGGGGGGSGSYAMVGGTGGSEGDGGGGGGGSSFVDAAYSSTHTTDLASARGDGSDVVTFTLPANGAPTVEVVPYGSCGPNGGTMQLLVQDPDGDPVTLSGSSDNQTALPDGNISFGGSGANRTITMTTVPQSSPQSALVTVTADDGTATSTLDIHVFVASPTGGKLIGTPGPDLMVGQGGRDTMDAKAGDDLICSAGARDIDYGRAGADAIGAGGGNDRIFGGCDDDQIFGQSGSDTMTGGLGADAFDGGPNRDVATDFNPGQGDTKTNIP